MNEQQITPVHIMKQIDRLFSKLKEVGATKIDPELSRTIQVVEGTVVVTNTMTINGKVIAEHKFVSPESLEEIKAKAEAQKQAIQDRVAPDIAELDEVISIVNSRN